MLKTFWIFGKHKSNCFNNENFSDLQDSSTVSCYCVSSFAVAISLVINVQVIIV